MTWGFLFMFRMQEKEKEQEIVATLMWAGSQLGNAWETFSSALLLRQG